MVADAKAVVATWLGLKVLGLMATLSAWLDALRTSEDVDSQTVTC